MRGNNRGHVEAAAGIGYGSTKMTERAIGRMVGCRGGNGNAGWTQQRVLRKIQNVVVFGRSNRHDPIANRWLFAFVCVFVEVC